MTQQRRPFSPLARAALLAGAAVFTLYLARPDGRAADKSDPPKAAANPLDFVPADAAGVFSIRVADLWNHTAVKGVREKLGNDLTELLKNFNPKLGVGVDEIDRFTLIEGTARGPVEEWVVVTTVRPADRKAILTAAAPNAEAQKVGDRTIYDDPSGTSVCFLDDRTILFARREALLSYLKRAGSVKEGPLTPVLKLASEKHLVVGGVDVAAVAATAPKKSEPPEWLKPLLKAQLATLTVDLDGEARANAWLTFGQEEDAKEGAAGLDAALDLFRGGIAQGLKQFTKEVDAPQLTAILDDAQTALKAAKAEQKGTTVEVAASLKIDPAAIVDAATEAAPKVREAAKRMQITNDLKQLVVAMHDYASANDVHLPPAAICDKNGKPLLSWRVALLPYIEQDALYEEFHLDEPWDSDHNKKLLEKMPTTFAPPESEAFKKHETFFQVFVGKGTPFETAKGLSLVQIPDGTFYTLAIVDAAKSVPWTKPDDIPFDEGKLLPKVGGLSKGGFFAAFCDGHVAFLPRTLKEETLRALVTANGGEVIPDLDK